MCNICIKNFNKKIGILVVNPQNGSYLISPIPIRAENIWTHFKAQKSYIATEFSRKFSRPQIKFLLRMRAGHFANTFNPVFNG